VFSDPVGAMAGVFSDAQAQGYAVVLIFIGISGPERSDQRVEQGQVTMEAEVLPPRWCELTGSGRSRP
jgi:predicted ABC-type ATPase